MPRYVAAIAAAVLAAFGTVAAVSPAQAAADPDSIAWVGDQLTVRDGSGPATVQNDLLAQGWDQVRVDANATRGVGTTANGAVSAVRNIKASGYDPQVWVMAVGINNRNASASNLTTWINKDLAAIGSGHTIVWLTTADKNAGDPSVVKFNAVVAAVAAQRTDLHVMTDQAMDWPTYIHAQPNQATLWSGSAGITMTAAGYLIRDDFTTAALAPYLSAPPPPPPPPPPPSSTCGTLAGQYDPASPPSYDHVVVIMMENFSEESFLTNTQTPYLHQLASECGQELAMHAATHPSQPNYMAGSSGVATGVGAKTNNDNLFHQMDVAGKPWADYVEDMPTVCASAAHGNYKPGHNPAFYYTDLLPDSCKANDIPQVPNLDNDLAADTLPSYTWITPNLCDDFHNTTGCNAPNRFIQGDTYLSSLIPRIVDTPSYQNGKTVVFITVDEGNETSRHGIDCSSPSVYVNPSNSCDIPTVVMSQYLASGSTDAAPQSLYSMEGTSADILGVSRLGHAVGAGSMRATLPF